MDILKVQPKCDWWETPEGDMQRCDACHEALWREDGSRPFKESHLFFCAECRDTWDEAACREATGLSRDAMKGSFEACADCGKRLPYGLHSESDECFKQQLRDAGRGHLVRP